MTSDEEDAVLSAVGGRPVMTGGAPEWNFGLRPSDPEMTARVTTPFDAGEEVAEITGDKVWLWEYCRLANGGKLPPFSYQLTGSCVNSGGQNAAIVRTAVEVVTLSRPEVFKIPFTLAAYGYSRHLLGDESEGEGSSGDQMAQALRDVGACPIDDPNCPKPNVSDIAIHYTRGIELQYSSWRKVPQPVKDASKPFNFRFGVVKTLDECEKELRRGRPLTFAGNWGGRMECGYKGEGEFRVLWNGGRNSTWNHQQSILGFWYHPTLGRIWWCQNNWFYQRTGNSPLISVHGETTQGEPPGGYWIGDADVQYQLSYRWGEVRSLMDFSGYTEGLINMGRI